jgi:hypothetical protein
LELGIFTELCDLLLGLRGHVGGQLIKRLALLQDGDGAGNDLHLVGVRDGDATSRAITLDFGGVKERVPADRVVAVEQLQQLELGGGGAVADGARRRCRRALTQVDDFGLIEIGPGNCVDEVELRVEGDAVGVVVQSGRRVASHLAGVEQDALVAASCSTVWG